MTKTCPICIDGLEDAYVTSCGHHFCKACIFEWITKEHHKCPSCRDVIMCVIRDREYASELKDPESDLKGTGRSQSRGATLTVELGPQFGRKVGITIKDNHPGMFVLRSDYGKMAYVSGVREGDIIMEIDDRPVYAHQQAIIQLERAKWHPVKVVILRPRSQGLSRRTIMSHYRVSVR